MFLKKGFFSYVILSTLSQFISKSDEAVYEKSYSFNSEDKRSLSFNTKRTILYSEFDKLEDKAIVRIRKIRKKQSGSMEFSICVNRTNILIDTYECMRKVQHKETLKLRSLEIQFNGEPGYGSGVKKEWFSLLSIEMMDKKYGLFRYSSEGCYFLQIDPKSSTDADTLSRFEFIGKFSALAIYHRELLSVCYSRPFLKNLLKRTVELADIKDAEPGWYRSLMWVKWTTIFNSELTFRVGNYELIPDGENTHVNFFNKGEFIRLAIEYKYVTRLEKQMFAFMKGFYSIVPYELIDMFSERELELLLCGEQIINVNEWKAHTLYNKYSKSSQPVILFWRVVSSFDNDERAKLLQFISGTRRLPPGGFKELEKFSIEKWGETDQLPESRTCLNKLRLPPYQNEKIMKEKLILAIESESPFTFE